MSCIVKRGIQHNKDSSMSSLCLTTVLLLAMLSVSTHSKEYNDSKQETDTLNISYLLKNFQVGLDIDFLQ